MGADLVATLSGETDDLEQHIGWIKVFQSGYTVVTFLLPAVIMVRFLRQPVFFGLQAHQNIQWWQLPLLAGIVFCAFPVVAMLLQLNVDLADTGAFGWLAEKLSRSGENVERLVTAMLRSGGWWGLAVNIIIMAVLPAVAEEACFRGVMQRLLVRTFGDPHVAVAVTGFIFAAIHLQFEGILPRWFLGIMLGYLYFWSANLWYPIIAHAIYNGMQVVSAYFKPELLDAAPEQGVNPNFPLWSTALFTLMLFFLLSMFYKQHRTAVNTPL